MKKFSVILGLCVLCFLPAVAIGFANGGQLTVDSLLHPFKNVEVPKKAHASPQTGVAFLNNAESMVVFDQLADVTAGASNVVNMPEVYIVGSLQSKGPEAVEVSTEVEVKEEDDGSSCWVQDSKVGGTVRICGFQPNE